MGNVKLTSKRTRHETVIIRADNSTSRNLLICAAAYNVVYKSVVVPAQELKDIHTKINNSKGIKLGSYAHPHESRMNPDTSSGLYVTAEYRVAARRVQNLKVKDKKEKVEQDVRTAEKKYRIGNKKETRVW